MTALVALLVTFGCAGPRPVGPTAEVPSRAPSIMEADGPVVRVVPRAADSPGLPPLPTRLANDGTPAFEDARAEDAFRSRLCAMDPSAWDALSAVPSVDRAQVTAWQRWARFPGCDPLPFCARQDRSVPKAAPWIADVAGHLLAGSCDDAAWDALFDDAPPQAVLLRWGALAPPQGRPPPAWSPALVDAFERLMDDSTLERRTLQALPRLPPPPPAVLARVDAWLATTGGRVFAEATDGPLRERFCAHALAPCPPPRPVPTGPFDTGNTPDEQDACVDGAPFDTQRCGCLARLSASDRPRAVAAARRLHDASPALTCDGVVAHLLEHPEPGARASLLRSSGLVPDADPAEPYGVDVLPLLIREGRAAIVDWESGEVPVQHDRLLRRLSWMCGGRLEHAVFAEQPPPEDRPDAGYQVSAWVGGTRFDVTASSDIGDFWDADAVLALLNQMAEHEGMPERFVRGAPTGRQNGAVLCVTPAQRRVLPDLGLPPVGDGRPVRQAR